MKKSKQRKKRKSTFGNIFFAVVILLQIIFTLLLRIVSRHETLKAVKKDDEIKLLLKTSEKKTETF